MKRLISFLLLAILTISVTAQDCPEIIKALLPNGIYEYQKIEINENEYKSLLRWYKENRDDTYQKSQERTASATIPIGDVLLGFGLTQDDQGYSRFILNIETYYNSFSKYSMSIKKSWTHINTTAIDKLKDCWLSTPGISCIKILTSDPRNVIVRFFYNNGYHDSPDFATISVNGKTDNLKISKRAVRKIKLRDKGQVEILLERTDDNAAAVVFSSNAITVKDLPLSVDLPSVIRQYNIPPKNCKNDNDLSKARKIGSNSINKMESEFSIDILPADTARCIIVTAKAEADGFYNATVGSVNVEIKNKDGIPFGKIGFGTAKIAAEVIGYYYIPPNTTDKITFKYWGKLSHNKSLEGTVYVRD